MTGGEEQGVVRKGCKRRGVSADTCLSFRDSFFSVASLVSTASNASTVLPLDA